MVLILFSTFNIYGQCTSIAGVSQTICAEQFTLQANNPQSISGSGCWKLPAGSPIILSNSTNYNAVAKSIPTGLSKLVWQVTCNTNVYVDTLFLTSNYVHPTAGQNQETCNGQASITAINPTTGVGTWSTKGQSIIANKSMYGTQVYNVPAGQTIFYWSINNLGCISEDSMYVVNNVVTVSNAGLTQQTCADTTHLAANNPVLGVGTWTCTLGNGVFDNSTLYNSKVNALKPDWNEFYWTITKGICSSATKVSIINNMVTKSNAGASVDACKDTIRMAANFPVNGSGNWLLISGNCTIVNPVSPVTFVKNLTLGANKFAWRISNINCADTSFVTITSLQISSAKMYNHDTIICSNTLNASAAKPTTGAGSWAMSFGGTLSSVSALQIVVRNMPPLNSYLYWIISKNSCHDTARIAINNKMTNADAGRDTFICNTRFIAHAADPGTNTGLWSTKNKSIIIASPSLFNTNITGIPSGKTEFYWLVKNSSCSSNDSVAVFNMGVYANAGVDTSICANSYLLQGNLPALGNVGQWSVISGSGTFENQNNNQSKIFGLTTGKNVIRWAINNSFCESADTVVVNVKNSTTGTPKIIGTMNVFPNSTSDYKSSEPAKFYSWILENTIISTDSMVAITWQNTQLDTTYMHLSLRLTLTCGTAGADTIVKLQKFETPATNQNIFTPNGDGVNDNFIISDIAVCPECFPENELYIYNRWGSLVFKASPYKNDWTGEGNGSLVLGGNKLPAGIYFYIFKLNKYNAKPKTGYFELRR